MYHTFNLNNLNKYDKNISYIPYSRNILKNNFMNGPIYQQVYKRHTGCVNAVALSNDPSRRFLASGGDDTSVLLWDAYEPISTSKPLAKFIGHSANIFYIMFSKDNSYLLSTGLDSEINMYNLETLSKDPTQAIRTFTRGHNSSVHRLSSLADSNNAFISGGYDKTVRLWDLRISSCQGILSLARAVNSVDCHPTDSNRCLISSTKLMEIDMRKLSWKLSTSTSESASNNIHSDPQTEIILDSASNSSNDSNHELIHSEVQEIEEHDDSYSEEVLTELRRFINPQPIVIDLHTLSINKNDSSAPILNIYDTFNCETSNAIYHPDGHLFVATIQSGFPLVFNTDISTPKYILYNKYYQNSITMKAAQFVGPNLEFVMSGSDNQNLYMWNINRCMHKSSDVFDIELELEPESKKSKLNNGSTLKHPDPIVLDSCAIWKGHRSIPNHVLYHDVLHRLYSCGVEKCVRTWDMQPFEQRAIQHLELTRRNYFGATFAVAIPRRASNDSMEECSLTLAQFDVYRYQQSLEDADVRTPNYFRNLRNTRDPQNIDQEEKVNSDRLIQNVRASMEAIHELVSSDFESEDEDSDNSSSDDSDILEFSEEEMYSSDIFESSEEEMGSELGSSENGDSSDSEAILEDEEKVDSDNDETRVEYKVIETNRENVN